MTSSVAVSTCDHDPIGDDGADFAALGQRCRILHDADGHLRRSG